MEMASSTMRMLQTGSLRTILLKVITPCCPLPFRHLLSPDFLDSCVVCTCLSLYCADNRCSQTTRWTCPPPLLLLQIRWTCRYTPLPSLLLLYCYFTAVCCCKFPSRTLPLFSFLLLSRSLWSLSRAHVLSLSRTFSRVRSSLFTLLLTLLLFLAISPSFSPLPPCV